MDSDPPGAAACSARQSSKCGDNAGPAFDCINSGVFPDPEDCTKYYLCTDDGAKGFIVDEYLCDPNRVFDPSGPRNEFCRMTFGRFCTVANCQGRTGNILMQYQFLPRGRGDIVVACRGQNRPLVFKCEPGERAKVNTLPVQCAKPCRRGGTYPFDGNDKKYYECIFNGEVWEEVVKNCMRNYYYDARRGQCVLSNTTPGLGI